MTSRMDCSKYAVPASRRHTHILQWVVPVIVVLCVVIRQSEWVLINCKNYKHHTYM